MKRREWSFDEEYLKDNINHDMLLATSKSLPEEQRNQLLERVYLYRVLLSIAQGQYENNLVPAFIPFNILKDKELILEKMQKDYATLDRRLIEFVLELDSLTTLVSFNNKTYEHYEAIEEIVERCLSLYNMYSMKFFKSAKEILNHPTSLVHVSKTTGCHSQCSLDEISNLPFIFVENTLHQPDNFVHELQHAIQFKEGYSTHSFYGELGPVVMETLYIDRMCEEQKDEAQLLYLERILEAQKLLHELACYFKAMLEFEKIPSVTKAKFLDVLNKYDLINMDLFGLDVRENCCYLLSFLNAIDIREKIYNNKKSGMKELMRKISSKKCYLNTNAQKVLRIYENYLNDICKKQK